MYDIKEIELDIKQTEKVEVKLPEESCSQGQFLTLYSKINFPTKGDKTVSFLQNKVKNFIEKYYCPYKLNGRCFNHKYNIYVNLDYKEEYQYSACCSDREEVNDFLENNNSDDLELPFSKIIVVDNELNTWNMYEPILH